MDNEQTPDLSKLHRSQLEAIVVDLAKVGERLRTRLAPIVLDIEDEGDRAYFGSTNDADELRELEGSLLETGNYLECKWMHGTDLYATIKDQAATITALEAEINLKADFIEETINQLAQADDDRAALQADNARLREALGRIEAQAVCVALPASPEERCDWLTNIAQIAAATLTGGDHG